jgi:hypothetical protein
VETCEVKQPDRQVSIRDGFYAAIGAYDKRRDVASVNELDVRPAIG